MSDKTKKLHILDRGHLSPQQILAATLNDPDFKEIETVIVLVKTNDEIFYGSWSHCKPSEKALFAAMLQKVALDEIGRDL